MFANSWRETAGSVGMDVRDKDVCAHHNNELWFFPQQGKKVTIFYLFLSAGTSYMK